LRNPQFKKLRAAPSIAVRGSVALLVLLAATFPSSPAYCADAAQALPTAPDDVESQLARAERARQEAQRTVARLRRSEEAARVAARRARLVAAGNKLEAAAARKAAEEAERRAEADRRTADVASRAATRAGSALTQARQREQATQARATLIRNLGIGLILALLLVAGAAVALIRRRYRRLAPPPVANAFLRSPTLNLHLPGTRLPKEAGGVVVGRNPKQAEVVITEEEISRRHARFFARDGAYWVEDLGSLGGTTVDGIELEPGAPRRLIPGAKIAFAGRSFEFDLDV
jgi:hypothetical protein